MDGQVPDYIHVNNMTIRHAVTANLESGGWQQHPVCDQVWTDVPVGAWRGDTIEAGTFRAITTTDCQAVGVVYSTDYAPPPDDGDDGCSR